jgi:hypothetical protein
MAIATSDFVVRDDEPLVANVDGEIMILSAKAEAYFGLGETGSRIWEMIATRRRVSDVCAELVNDYDVDRQTCERDTLAFLTKLLEDRLIRIVKQEPSTS